MTKKSIISAVLSGFVMVFAFPPFDIWPIAWFGIAPLFFAIHDKKPRERFLLGFIWGIVFFLGTVYWVVNSMVNYGNVPIFASIVVLLLLVSVLSLYPAIFAYFLPLAPCPLLLIFIPCLWVSLEYIRTFLFTGFPWVLLGYSQTAFLPIMQIADITGAYGVSFLIVMVNVFLFKVITYFKTSDFRLQTFKEGAVVFLILVLALAYGYFRMNQIDKLTKVWKQLKVGIAQGNINQAHKWNPEYQEETINIYKKLSEEIAEAGQDIDLIVWPETATPFWLQSDEKLGPIVFDVAKNLSINLITGTPSYRYSSDGLTTNYFNSVFLISKKGEISGRYDKVHLVPFGEYVPLKRFLPFEKLVAGIGDFSAGKDLTPLSLNGYTFGVLICFEAIFSHLAKEFLNHGADFLITVTNDAWFGKSSAPYQHLYQAAVRSIENRVFLVRSANTGISAVIDPVGRIKAKSGLFTREVIASTISLKEKGFLTFYTRYGDVFAFLCMIISTVILLMYFKKVRM